MSLTHSFNFQFKVHTHLREKSDVETSRPLNGWETASSIKVLRLSEGRGRLKKGFGLRPKCVRLSSIRYLRWSSNDSTHGMTQSFKHDIEIKFMASSQVHLAKTSWSDRWFLPKSIGRFWIQDLLCQGMRVSVSPCFPHLWTDWTSTRRSWFELEPLTVFLCPAINNDVTTPINIRVWPYPSSIVAFSPS